VGGNYEHTLIYAVQKEGGKYKKKYLAITHILNTF